MYEITCFVWRLLLTDLFGFKPCMWARALDLIIAWAPLCSRTSTPAEWILLALGAWACGFACGAATVGFLLSHRLRRVCSVVLWELLRADHPPAPRPRSEDRLAGYRDQ